MAEDDLLDVGLDLRHGVSQFIIGVVDLFRTNSILNRNRNGDEHVVFGLGLHGQTDLIHAQAHDAGNRIEERPLPVQAGVGDSKELTEARDHGDFSRAHGEKASQNQVEHDERHDRDRNPIQLIHLLFSAAAVGAWLRVYRIGTSSRRAVCELGSRVYAADYLTRGPSSLSLGYISRNL